jgi:hypothetical protein
MKGERRTCWERKDAALRCESYRVVILRSCSLMRNVYQSLARDEAWPTTALWIAICFFHIPHWHPIPGCCRVPEESAHHAGGVHHVEFIFVEPIESCPAQLSRTSVELLRSEWNWSFSIQMEVDVGLNVKQIQSELEGAVVPWALKREVDGKKNKRSRKRYPKSYYLYRK